MTTALEGGEGSASRLGRSLPPGKDPISIVQEDGWAPGSVWTGAENLLSPTGIRSPDRPTRSRSLYRLCYPAHNHGNGIAKIGTEFFLPALETEGGFASDCNITRRQDSERCKVQNFRFRKSENLDCITL
jgi:hypothetical protein